MKNSSPASDVERSQAFVGADAALYYMNAAAAAPEQQKTPPEAGLFESG